MGLVLLYMVVWFEFECDVFYEYCDWVVLWFGWVGGCGVLWLFVGCEDCIVVVVELFYDYVVWFVIVEVFKFVYEFFIFDLYVFVDD